MAAPMIQVARALKRIIALNYDKMGINPDKGIQLGIPNLIPITPYIGITMDKIVSEVHGAPQIKNDLYLRLTVFFSDIKSVEEKIEDAVVFGQVLIDLINSNSHLTDENGIRLITYGMVTQFETGIATKDNSQNIYRTITLTYEAMHLEIMPNPTN
jgi:hypothetical protein